MEKELLSVETLRSKCTTRFSTEFVCSRTVSTSLRWFSRCTHTNKHAQQRTDVPLLPNSLALVSPNSLPFILYLSLIVCEDRNTSNYHRTMCVLFSSYCLFDSMDCRVDGYKVDCRSFALRPVRIVITRCSTAQCNLSILCLNKGQISIRQERHRRTRPTCVHTWTECCIVVPNECT